MNWYIGQRVVANTDFKGQDVGNANSHLILVSGQEYIIRSLTACTCGKVALDVGFDAAPGSKARCKTCQSLTPTFVWWITEKYFNPLEEKTDEVKQEFKEVTYTKIKELVPQLSEN